MLDAVLTAFVNLADINVVLVILGGVTIGMIGGALPGISPSITIALLLPVAFSLDPIYGLVGLGAIYMAAEYGGSISAILINTPGTAAAVCTALDGHPMATQGRAQEALHSAILASSIGGFIGIIVLMLFTPPLAELSLKFQGPELFWLAVAGLAIVCNLTADNFVKGVLAALLGLFISTVGYDTFTSFPRFSFGIPEIEASINIVPAIIGFFALPYMLNLAGARDRTAAVVTPQPGSFGRVTKFILMRPILVLRSSLIGTFIGILPGAGASIATFVSYSEAKRFAKDPSQFGKGAMEGVIASESANNSMVGGSLVPLLAFGIPGSASAAVLFGAVTLYGMIPGPRLFTEHRDVVYGFMVGFIPIVIGMLIVGATLTPLFARVLKVRMAYTVSTVLVLALIGSYTIQGSIVDIYIAATFGVLGFFMMKLGFSLAPIVLGLILGPMAEEGFRRSLIIAEADGESIFSTFFGRPISIGLIAVIVVMVFTAFWQEYRGKKRFAQMAENGH